MTPKNHVSTIHPPSGSSSPGTSVRLTSWKEIAAFFGRDVRTVQLWEKTEGLPIHRHKHYARASVYAYTYELEEWLKRRTGNNGTETSFSSPPPSLSQKEKPSALRGRPALLGLLMIASLGLTVTLIWKWMRPRRPYMTQSVIAVLPFENVSGNPQEELVLDGFTDTLIADLGRTGQLQVIARQSVMPFKGKEVSYAEITRQLHANLVLEGSFVEVNGHLRVTSRLTDALSGRQIWSENYLRDTGSLLTAEDEIAADIAIGVMENLLGKPPSLNLPLRPVSPSVRMAYLTGRFFWNRRDIPDMEKAIVYFQQALAEDSSFAPAWSGLADAYNLLAVWGNSTSQEAFPKAREAAQKALVFDPSSAEAYTSLAFETYHYEWDFNRADTYFRRAIQLNPNYVTAHQWYGEFLGDMYRFKQSIAESRKAVELDPLSAIAGADLADSYLHAGRYAEAKTELKRVLGLYPNFAPAHNYLSSVLVLMGDLRGAEKEAETYARLSGDISKLEEVRISALIQQGSKLESRRRTEDLLHRSSASLIHYQKAVLYFQAGEKDAGYTELERAYQDHSWWMVTMLVDPGFLSVRQEPRFLELAHHVGLPEPSR